MPEYLKEGYLRDMTRPIAVGERVNMHVIQAVRQLEPDYEAMRRVIAGHGDAAGNRNQDDPVV